jgi:hypothetical protein
VTQVRFLPGGFTLSFFLSHFPPDPTFPNCKSVLDARDAQNTKKGKTHNPKPKLYPKTQTFKKRIYSQKKN